MACDCYMQILECLNMDRDKINLQFSNDNVSCFEMHLLMTLTWCSAPFDFVAIPTLKVLILRLVHSIGWDGNMMSVPFWSLLAKK